MKNYQLNSAPSNSHLKLIQIPVKSDILNSLYLYYHIHPERDDI